MKTFFDSEKANSQPKSKSSVWFKSLFAIGLVFSLAIAMQACKKDNVFNISPDQTQDIKLEMRQLWAEHMEWTYATVDAFFHDQNGLSAKLNRLLKNQTDIGEALVPYFGQENSQKLAGLLTEHIQGAVPVLSAAQNGDNAALEQALDDWYANAQEVGDHLAAINPEYWAQPVLRDMWKTHITQTVTYSVALLQNELEKAVSDYQEAYNHMMGMGDIMSDGIIKKFPDKF